MPGGSYHTHNTYCDGRGSIEDMIRAALEVGLDEIGISSHAPLPFSTPWTMDPDQLPAYVSEVRSLRDRYAGRIRVRLGLELDFIPDERVLAFQRDSIFSHDIEFYIGSVHFLGEHYPPQEFDGSEEGYRRILEDEYCGNIEGMVEEYFRRIRTMLDLPRIDFVGHLDRIKRWNAGHAFFTGREPWYVSAVECTLDAIESRGIPIEVNTSGWLKGVGEPYPSAEILAACGRRGIPIIISSDAHAPAEIIHSFEEARALLREAGIAPVMLSPHGKR
jgi:histidinol-phosphatase (PHP family)